MNKHVYNVSLLAGWVLTSVGAGLIYVPAGIVTAGVLLIGLTLIGAKVAGGR